MPIADYEPGQFYKRELPCILKLLGLVEESISCILVDGYCYLSPQKDKGIGAYLYHELNEKVPVIGVAKNPFKNNDFCVSVFRAKSKKPLYITSAGLTLSDAVHYVNQLAGDYRIPHLLKKVDSIVRAMQQAYHSTDWRLQNCTIIFLVIYFL